MVVDAKLAKCHLAVKHKMREYGKFQEWLIERGRHPDTAREYSRDIAPALDHPDGPLARLRSRKLSPNTLARLKAALRAWAAFSGDAVLESRLKDFRLPPAQRVQVKTPLTKDDWQKLVRAVDSDGAVLPAVRAVVALMAIRGFRVGDVLRLRRKEVEAALRTGVLSFEGKGSVRHQYDVKNFKGHLQRLLDEGDWDRVANVVSDRAKKDPQKSARRAVARGFKTIGENAGFRSEDLYPHRLRRSYATYYLEAVGNDIEKLRQHMGWANISTAAKYVDAVNKKELDQAATKMIEGMLQGG